MAEAKRPRAKRSGTPASIRESLKKATTEMLVLYVLCKKSMYTYEMMHEIEEMSDGKITFNTLYQAIYRLQEFQYIVEQEKVLSEDNRIRIYFAITDTGRTYLDQIIAEYFSFTGVVNEILKTPPAKEGKAAPNKKKAPAGYVDQSEKQ